MNSGPPTCQTQQPLTSNLFPAAHWPLLGELQRFVRDDRQCAVGLS